MAMTPQQAANGAAAFAYLEDKLAAIIYLLNTGNMTPAQIASGAACFACLENKLGAIIYLLANASGGGGGSGQIVTYTSGVPNDPTDISHPAIAYDPTQNLQTLYWNQVAHTWSI